MIDKLIEALSSTDFEDYGSLLLKEASWLDDEGTLTLQIEVNIDENSVFPSNWEIACQRVRIHQLNLGYSNDFRFDLDHVLSWEYCKPCCSVSFHGKTDDPLAIVGGLYKTHTRIAQNWIPFNKYFNESIQIDKLIDAGFGQIIQNAPDEFAIGYENVMQSYGFLTSRSESHLPFYWRDSTRLTSVLLSTMIFDRSYVVAESFEANPV